MALAIIAVALAAARATGLMAANNRALQDKALALIAAQNALVLLRLEQTLPRPARAPTLSARRTAAGVRAGLHQFHEPQLPPGLRARARRECAARRALAQLDGLLSSLR